MLNQSEDQKIGQLEALMQHPGWTVLKEDLASRMQGLLQRLVAPQGNDTDNDDNIRGQFKFAEFVLTGYEKIVKMHKAKKYLDGPAQEDDGLPAIGSPFDPAGIDSQPAGE